jgi:hypothetical protein
MSFDEAAGSPVRAAVIDPYGRTIVLTERGWEHVMQDHAELARYEIAHLEFDHVRYDRDGDVLYLSVGEPRAAADSS